MRPQSSPWRILLVMLGVVSLLSFARGLRPEVQISPAPLPTPTESLAGRSGLLKQMSDESAEVAAKVAPSVVSIDATAVLTDVRGPGQLDPFVPHQGGFIQGEVPVERRVPSVGSGVIVRPDGYIVTNRHVIQGVREIRITFSDKTVSPAKLIGSDATTDLAVLKVDGLNLPCLPYADSKKVRIGEFVLAIGNPLGMQGSVSHGIVSSKDRRNVGQADYEDYIQTDAAINPGNSGGALVNLEGELLGINAALLGKSGGSQGLGLAIPAEVVQKVVEELIAHGRVRWSWLGLFVGDLSPYGAQHLGLSQVRGVLVMGGYNDSPAGKVGFHANDVILEMDGLAIYEVREMRRALANIPVGDEVTFRIWRERRPMELKVKTEPRPTDVGGHPFGGL